MTNYDLAPFTLAPNRLARFYREFNVEKRLLLTGHSHQAWPDCGFTAQQECWYDAARHVDDKWDKAFEKADRVRRGFARLLEDTSGQFALGANTHELIVRFLSALPLIRRPRIVTTDSEFHTLRRQLDALSNSGLVEVVKVPAHPVDTCADTIASAINDRTAAVMISAVFFNSGHIMQNISGVAQACRKHGVKLLVDAYHALNVVPCTIKENDLEDAFVVGGGYKYCQLGEGNCFLRFPQNCDIKPIVTGWFSEFSALEDKREPGQVLYGQGADLFAGSTYDPVSHYRAAEIFDFFEHQKLTVELLRQISMHQIAFLQQVFDALDFDETKITRDRKVTAQHLGGFLVLTAENAGELSQKLKEKGVYTDARGTSLRFGPAPYLTDMQLEKAMNALKKVMPKEEESKKE